MLPSKRIKIINVDRTHDVMGQIEYNSILPFPHLSNKDRSRLKPIDLISILQGEASPTKALSTVAKVIFST
jgi:hypothetical protein